MEDLYIVSRCLLGENCKYNGGNNLTPDVVQFYDTHRCVTVCPECRGGLPAPRPPAEIVRSAADGYRIVDRNGRDVTEAFLTGAALSWADVQEYAERNGCRIAGAVLKANSPSCGHGVIYDGTFSGRRIPGDGVFAAILRGRGIPVRTEEDLDAQKE